jgi:hypothetical protein
MENKLCPYCEQPLRASGEFFKCYNHYGVTYQYYQYDPSFFWLRGIVDGKEYYVTFNLNNMTMTLTNDGAYISKKNSIRS